VNPAARHPPQLGNPRQVVRTVFGCEPEAVAPTVVLSPFVPLKAFRRHVQKVVAELAPPFFFKGFSAVFKERPVTVIHTGVGPSRIGDCLGFLALTPARRVCFAGAVGALNPEYQLGEFFVPTAAADGEGYSRYCREPFPQLAAAAPVVACPAEADGGPDVLLAAEKLCLHRGLVFTVGSIAFESPENLRTLRELGFDVLEMELSAFYTAAAHHGFAATSLTYVSDLPLTRSLWQEKTAEEREALRRAYRALPLLALRHATGLGIS
jgi:purine-nucleoside phosphorylase